MKNEALAQANMKHLLRKYEEKRTYHLKRGPKARFIGEGGFIIHAPQGALRSDKKYARAKSSGIFFGLSDRT